MDILNTLLIILVVLLVIENSRYRVLAVKDGLSGLLNKRQFDMDFKATKFGRKNDNHILMLLDVNKFKLINDEQGHAAGDAVIRDIGICLTTHLRSSDKVYRIGGDEFAILTNNLLVSDKIKDILTVSVSIGVVNLSDYKTTGEAFKAADENLYKNKRSNI